MKKQIDVITIGESMVVFNPLQDVSFIDSHLFMKQIAGAESNVAIGLSRFGHKVGWISRLSNDVFGYFVHNILRGNGVDTSFVEFDDTYPTGLLIKERIIQNQTNVYYYRKNTAASYIGPEVLDDKYLAQAKYLFITGITPVLSESCHETIFSAIKMAKQLGLKIVFDPNVRYKLIDNEAAYKNMLHEIVGLVDYFLPGKEEAKFLCGFDTPEEISKFYLAMNDELTIVLKLGEKGCYYKSADQEEYIEGIKVDKVVDSIGAGDGFTAGFVSGLLDGLNIRESLIQANIVGAMIVQSNGDIEGFPNRNQFNSYKDFVLDPEKDEVNR
ncbi:sugar kinase [Pseudogracilibacillus sp. SE30717A]|uniref:sugar kinase n=1 Tax=Pseudogracilibacillus sp. SE30717A TaxID=3098293 RepID=UPI00300E46AD